MRHCPRRAVWDDLDLDEDAGDIDQGVVPPYIIQAELRRLVDGVAVKARGGAETRARGGGLRLVHEAVVEVEVPSSLSKLPEGGPRPRARPSRSCGRSYKTTTGPRWRASEPTAASYCGGPPRARAAAPGPASFRNSGVPGPGVRF